MTQEATFEQIPSGSMPATPGWFVVNVRDAAWFGSERFGSACVFESREAPFRDYGVNIRVLEPGQPNALYHSETAEESFLVLAGECLVLIGGEERHLRAWDFVHCPPDTAHVFVGAGDAPAVILMLGARPEQEQLRYPVSEPARAHGASVERETGSPEEAYRSVGATPPAPGRPRSWERLPWA